MCRRRCGVMPQRLDEFWGFCRQVRMPDGMHNRLAIDFSDAMCRSVWYVVCETGYV